MTPNSVLLDTSVVIRHFRDANALADKLTDGHFQRIEGLTLLLW